MVGYFTEITVSKSDNELHLIRVTSARLDDRLPDILREEIWRTVSLWMFLLLLSSVLVTSLLHYFFGSRPSTNGVGTGFYHLRRPVKWRWSFPVRRIRRMATIWYWFIVGLIGSYDCVRWKVFWLFPFLFFSTLVRDYAAQGVCT